jgi:hypothetical protein
MADGLKFTLTKESQARFSNGLKLVARVLGKDVPIVIKQLAIFASQAAKKRTVTAKKNRPVITANNAKERRMLFGGRKYAVQMWSQRQSKLRWHYVMTKEERDALKPIKYAGAARHAWSGVMAKLGKTMSSAGGTLERVAMKGSAVYETRASGHYQMTIVNRLGYAEKHTPGLTIRALASAQARFAAYYEKKLGNAIRHAFEGKPIGGVAA